MKSKEDIDELLARHWAGESLSDEQQKQLQEWIAGHAEEYRCLESLVNDMTAQADVPVFDAHRAWQKVEPRLKSRPSHSLSVGKRLATYWWAAASLALLLVVGSVYLVHTSGEEVVRYANLGKSAKQIVLPDSTVVVLYPSARLAYTDGGSRLAELEGKAFFRVKKNGKRFKVDAGQLDVEVLGTSFLVDAGRQEQPGVFVETGRVRVTAREDEAILTAGQQAVLESDGDKLQVDEIENPRKLFGKKQQLVFDHAPVREVVDEVQRQTGIVIELGAGFEAKRITTRLDLNNGGSIAAELAFVCGSKCDTLEVEKHYRLYYE